MGFQVIYYCCRLHLRIFMLQKRKKKTGGKKNIVCLFFNAQSTHSTTDGSGLYHAVELLQFGV